MQVVNPFPPWRPAGLGRPPTGEAEEEQERNLVLQVASSTDEEEQDM